MASSGAVKNGVQLQLPNRSEKPLPMSAPSSKAHLIRTILFILVLLVIPVVAAIYFFRLPHELAFLARTEEGIVEQTSHWLWFAAVAVSLILGIVYKWKQGLLGAWFFLALTFRELDFHIRFTPENMNSIRFWKSGEISIPAKLLAFTFIAFTAWTIFHFFRRSWPWFRKAWAAATPLSQTIVAIFAFVAVPYSLDNILDMDDLENPTVLFGSILEETLETGIPALILLALFQWWGHHRSERMTS